MISNLRALIQRQIGGYMMFRQNTPSDVDIQSTPLCPEDANRAGQPYVYQGDDAAYTNVALNSIGPFTRSSTDCVYEASFPRFRCGLTAETPSLGLAPNQGSSTPKNANLQGGGGSIVVGFRHYKYSNGNMYFYSDHTLAEVNAALIPNADITITYFGGSSGPSDPIPDDSAIPLENAYGLGHVYGTVRAT